MSDFPSSDLDLVKIRNFSLAVVKFEDFHYVYIYLVGIDACGTLVNTVMSTARICIKLQLFSFV
jgi:hypothetical protein